MLTSFSFLNYLVMLQEGHNGVHSLEIVTRFKRAAKELLGRKQWPKREVPRPKSYEEQLYEALICQDDICFDVGANQGEVSLFLAQLLGDTGEVIAFEPVWSVYTQLCQKIQYDTTLKAPIITIPAGLADTDGDATINVPNGNFAMGSIADSVTWGKAQQGLAINSYRVRLTTIDSFLAVTGCRVPSFIKIDVEGAELLVLQGAAGMFSRGKYPLMLIEVFAPWEKAFGYQPWEFFSLLLNMGYRFLFACPSGLIEHLPTESKPFPLGFEMGYNVIIYSPNTHSERIDRLKHLKAGTLVKLLPMAPPPQPNYME